jgi:poly(3-hydroxybutyrate) depolymerase/6-phosphogluconolactonase (cycloisomerase 2 family)
MTHEIPTLASQPSGLGNARREPRRWAVPTLRLSMARSAHWQKASMQMWKWAATALLMLAMLTSVTQAQEATGRTAALAFVDVVRNGYNGVEGLYGARGVAMSHDGAHLYIASLFDAAVAVFARNPLTGALSLVEVQRQGVGGVDGLGYAAAVAVSPDDAHVYAVGYTDDAVVVFARDAATGKLGFVETQRNGMGAVNGLGGPTAVAVSPDGANVYVAGCVDNAVALFARDHTTGTLQFLAAQRVDGLTNTCSVTVSPDGAFLYATSASGNALAVFGRDPNTGALQFVESEKVSGLKCASAVAVSPDSAYVYAVGNCDNAVVAFARNAQTGGLTVVDVQRDGMRGVEGLVGAWIGLQVSPDGTRVYVSSAVDNALVMFARDPMTGVLSFLEALRDERDGVDGLAAAAQLAVSPDGGHVYAAGIQDNAVAVFSVTASRCAGDCNGDGEVTVDELLRGVNVTLGSVPVSACPVLDRDANGAVSVDELLIAVGAVLDSCPAVLTAGDHARSLVIENVTRLYDVHVPPNYHGTAAVPLVLDFHGFQGNKTGQSGWSGFRELADTEGFVVAYPLGRFGARDHPEVATALGPAWDALVCCTLARVDDVGFARAIVQAVSNEANIDLRRVYATGLSNGGAMVHRLACEAADTFAAVAPVSFPLAIDCNPSRPIAVLHFAGLTDETVPYAGGQVINAGAPGPIVPSAADSFAHWRDLDGCGSSSPDQHIDAGGSFCETYTHCTAGVQVEQCSINGSLDTEAPGHWLYINPDMNIAATAWRFFLQFSLPAE